MGKRGPTAEQGDTSRGVNQRQELRVVLLGWTGGFLQGKLWRKQGRVLPGRVASGNVPPFFEWILSRHTPPPLPKSPLDDRTERPRDLRVNRGRKFQETRFRVIFRSHNGRP